MPTPNPLATALLQRMRRFNRVERTVLMRASVIGQHFSVTILTAATTFDEDRVRTVLEKACALQFVVRETVRVDSYAFRHALIRDVAYEEFIATQLRPIHRRIARALERCPRTNDAALDDLAYHSWAAGDAARCVRYNELAGDRAAAIFATDDARTYYARACEFTRLSSKQQRRLTAKLLALPGDA